MGSLILVGEDRLCCALGHRLVSHVLGWALAQPAVDTGGVTKLRTSLPRYLEVARHFPVLCIADVDRGCAARISEEWCGNHAPAGFMLRLAVREAESWVMADGDGLSEFLGVPSSKVPARPDEDDDPKRTLLRLARRARARNLRREMVSGTDPSKQGTGYNVHLSTFVGHHWSPTRAEQNSPSLARAIARLNELKGQAA